MQRVRQMVLVTATLAGCGAAVAIEGLHEHRPSWVDSARLEQVGIYGRGQAYAVSNPHLRVNTADEQARAVVAKTAKARVSGHLATLKLDDTVRDEVTEGLHAMVYSQAKVIARFYARDRLRQYSLARLDDAGYVRQIDRLRISDEAKRVLKTLGDGIFPDGG